jgi:LruC domain-containing protein
METKSWVKLNGLILLIAAMLIIQSACKKSEPTETPVAAKDINDLVIPENFEFETTQEVTIHFQDQLKAGSAARYDVFLHSDRVFSDTVMYFDDEGNQVIDTVQNHDNSNDLIAQKVSETGLFDLIVSIPAYITELYVIKNEMGLFSSQIIQVNSKSATFNGGYKSGKDDPLDIFYGVKTNGDLFTINPATGELVVIDDLPKGSEACAIDAKNRKLYFIGHSSPYPLYSYDIDTKVSTLIKNLKMKAQGLAFNEEDGLLYMSYRDKLYTIDTQNGDVLTQKNIYGLDNKNSGDIARAANGKWYVANQTGVYWLEFKTEKVYAHSVNDDLPFNPSGMIVDSNDDLWISKQGNSSKFIKMNKSNGNFEYVFTDFNHPINDLAVMPLEVAPIIDDDADDDGIIDYYDEYPTDPQRAYNTYTPSILGRGSLSFEDRWPSKGDYDFNDLLVYYHFTTVMNAVDKVVEIKCKFTIEHIGASYINGFGFELPLSPGLVSHVTGYNHTEGFVNVNAQGLETGQTKAVVIVVDNANDNLFTTLNMVISFDEPLEPSLVGTPPYNPFLIINKDRTREVHLVNFPPTGKASPAFFGTLDDRSIPAQGKYYRTINKLPWVINMLDGFVIPNEGTQISKAYTKFNDWAESGGTVYSDWYKNFPGYRDADYLKPSK